MLFIRIAQRLGKLRDKPNSDDREQVDSLAVQVADSLKVTRVDDRPVGENS